MHAVLLAVGLAPMLLSAPQARDSAAVWLGRRAVTLPIEGQPSTAFNAKFDSIARNARVIGLGEATHGSREFGDVRLLLTQRAIERAGIGSSPSRTARYDSPG